MRKGSRAQSKAVGSLDRPPKEYQLPAQASTYGCISVSTFCCRSGRRMNSALETMISIIFTVASLVFYFEPAGRQTSNDVSVHFVFVRLEQTHCCLCPFRKLITATSTTHSTQTIHKLKSKIMESNNTDEVATAED